MRMAAVFLCLISIAAPAAETLDAYAGRYLMADGSVLVVSVRDQTLTLKPIFWTSLQWLRAVSPDQFVVTDRPERHVAFERDASGAVVAVRIDGIGDDTRLVRLSGPPRAVELLFDHKAEAAAKLALHEAGGMGRAIDFGQRLAERFPWRVADAVAYLRALERSDPANSRLQRVLGDALVASGARADAHTHYQRAKGDAEAARALQMLDSAEPDEKGWTLPFTLSQLFRAPAADEIAKVSAMWARRDLRPHDVQIVSSRPIDIGSSRAMLRIVSHRIYGAKHFVAIIGPVDAKPGSCPVIVDAKGVSWDYFPRDLGKLPDSVALMEGDAARFVYVIPSFRGETIVDGEQKYQSEGDRTDVWDGASDDAIAALNVALKVSPEADASSICTFGRSRGGTVALLAAIRDPQIRCVVAWAAPADHFQLMGQGGWTRQEAVAEGLRERSAPNGIGGQFIETFLRAAIAGERDLGETRLHLIASSPLYFAGRLPELQLHYGADDPIVPIANGEALKSHARRVDAFFYPGFGHDADKDAAYKHAHAFLVRALTRAAASAGTE